MSITSELGRRIKELRQKQNMTLKEIESRVEVSATHVSEIERGKTTPTVGALNKIAAALEVEPSFFLTGDELPAAELCRADERPEVEFSRDGFSVEPLSSAVRGQDLSAGLLRWKAQCDTAGPHLREGEQFAVILQGAIILEAGSERHELAAGDAVHFRSGIPHRVLNPGHEDCLAFWAASPRFGF